MLYLLGGGDDLLPLAHRQWEATTRLLTQYGNVYKEYERGYDQFHQAESYIYFYLLCLADPNNPLLAERAQRFAGFYLNEDPRRPTMTPAEDHPQPAQWQRRPHPHHGRESQLRLGGRHGALWPAL